MGVLILHNGPRDTVPYDRWLSDYRGKIVLLPSDGDEVEARALELARRHRVDRIIACQEQDLERAAQLREILGLPGQRLSSVLPFRDKTTMKDAARAAGIPVAPYQTVECATDIIVFARDHGLPVVIKPRDGAGVTTLRTPESLDAFVSSFELPAPDLMVESYVRGPVYHVNGLVIGGQVALSWPSRYLLMDKDFAELTLDADDPLTPRLLEFTDQVLEALPCPQSFPFHVKVFHAPDGGFVLGDVACRTGDAAISQALFGVDVDETWARVELGLAPRVALGCDAPSTMAGRLSMRSGAGAVRPAFPWVEQYVAVSSDVVSVVVTGVDRSQVEERLRWLRGLLG